MFVDRRDRDLTNNTNHDEVVTVEKGEHAAHVEAVVPEATNDRQDDTDFDNRAEANG